MVNLIDVVDDYLIAQRKEEDKKHPKVRHSVSSFSSYVGGEYIGTCLRQQFYQWIKAEPTNLEPKSFYAMTYGNIIHDWLYEIWASAGYGVETEDELEFIHTADGLKYPVKGRGDARVTSNGIRELVDIKTVNPAMFRYKDLPKKEHVMQLSYYKRFIDADTYSLLYFSRADFNRRIYYLGQDFEPIDTTDYTMWKHLEECLENKKPPKRSYDKSDWHCKYCNYRTLCYEVHKNV
jgi:CRISPR/Cas system-associated exonuclease Cas4 (RecB family)